MNARTGRRALSEIVMQRKAYAVYFIFAEDDELIYVGMTEDLDKRFKVHASLSPWWSSAHRLVVEPYDTYGQAVDAERAAILHQAPTFNTLRVEINDDQAENRVKHPCVTLTTRQAAEATGLAPSTLRRWASTGAVKPSLVTVGKRYKWDLDDLRRQLEELRG